MDDPRRQPPASTPPHHLPFLTLVLLLLIAFYAFHGPLRSMLSGRYRASRTFDKALDLVLDEYVEKPDPDELVHGALEGLVKSLPDKHSAFLSPHSNSRQQEVEHGQYAGLGIVIRLRERRTIIYRVFPNTPAELAGLRAGDILVAADGRDLSKVEQLEEVSKALRGEAGSTAKLVVERDGERIEVAVTRAIIRRPIVEHKMLVPGIGYVRVADFPDGVARLLAKALSDLRGEGARGLVLDVRRNNGGFLDEAVRVADLFIADGLIVRTQSRHASDNRVFRARPGGPAEALPLVVLVDGESASAAEVVAGALQDHGRAPLVGTKTYGKGAVNKRFELPDGSGLLITTGKYYLPKGRQIEGEGLTPDVEVEPPSPQQLRDVPPGVEPPDPQRDRAVRLLRQRLALDE